MSSPGWAPRELSAQPAAAGDNKSQARDLFKKGTKAFDDKKHAEALVLLEQAEGFFHAPTHVLYIARSQAALGKLTEARASYQKLVSETLPPKASDAFRDAQSSGKKELEALDARIPKVIVTPDPKDAPGLVVTMNGTPLAADRLGVEFGVNPGSFSFEAKAEGLEAGRVIVNAAERTTTEVALVLHKIGQKPAVESGAKTVEREAGGSGMRIASFALMGVGGGALVAGGVMGALHFVRSGEADDKFAECGASCRAEVESLDKDTALFGNAAIGLLAGGGAVVGTGLLLFLLAPSGPSDEAPAPATVSFGPGFVSVTGRF